MGTQGYKTYNMKTIYFILIISISFGAKGQVFDNSQTIINPDGNEHFDDFGGSVLAVEGIVFIGAPAEDETNDERTMNHGSFPYLYGGVGKGKVYVYSKRKRFLAKGSRNNLFESLIYV